MKTILFVTGDNSVYFVDTVRELGYSVLNLVDFKNYKQALRTFKKQPQHSRKSPILCLTNPPKEIQKDIYQNEMTFSIHTTSNPYAGSPNLYDVIISGNSGNSINEIERVMKIITN